MHKLLMRVAGVRSIMGNELIQSPQRGATPQNTQQCGGQRDATPHNIVIVKGMQI